jgi:hypothetical protein
MRPGDIVLHKPSSEQWLVGKVCENGGIYACGWPCSFAPADDIEMLEECTDDRHQELVARLKRLPIEDPRYIPHDASEQARSET